MRSPSALLFSKNRNPEEHVQEHAPRASRRAWTQIVVEINEVSRFAMPLRGDPANIGFAGPANRDGREVISFCSSVQPESNAKI
jgi:hypothetical protein